MHRSLVQGRSRLPADGTWTSRHTISTGSGGDSALPCAHTCFNTIDLPVRLCPRAQPTPHLLVTFKARSSLHPSFALPSPALMQRYSSEAILRQRLLTAVTYGLGGILNG